MGGPHLHVEPAGVAAAWSILRQQPGVDDAARLVKTQRLNLEAHVGRAVDVGAACQIPAGACRLAPFRKLCKPPAPNERKHKRSCDGSARRCARQPTLRAPALPVLMSQPRRQLFFPVDDRATWQKATRNDSASMSEMARAMCGRGYATMR